MRLIIIKLVTPPAQVYGYFRRFMVEMERGLLVGSCTKVHLEDILRVMRESKPKGWLVVSDTKAETGFEIRYYCRKDSQIADFDGVFLPITLKKSMG